MNKSQVSSPKVSVGDPCNHRFPTKTFGNDKFKFTWNEWTGALGDIGTFLPLYLTLVALNGLPPVRTLILAGLLYIIAALYFRLPVPVQPLKAMAGICIAQGLGMDLLMAAGIWMGLILLGLAVSGKIDWLAMFFSRPIVKGIQLGVGLLLVKTGLELLIAHSGPQLFIEKGVGPAFPTLQTFAASFWLLVIPQLPLTLGNAVYAASDVAKDYFGNKARRMTPKSLAASLGISNIVIGFLGGLPLCHGSGGMTAHVRFGARTGGATIIAGSLFILAAVMFQNNIFSVLQAIPLEILGVMVLYVGFCHIWLLRKLESKKVLALSMGLIGLATHNLAYALLFGLIFDRIGNRQQIPKFMMPVI